MEASRFSILRSGRATETELNVTKGKTGSEKGSNTPCSRRASFLILTLVLTCMIDSRWKLVGQVPEIMSLEGCYFSTWVVI